MPVFSTHSPTTSMCQYMSEKHVVPLCIISAIPRFEPALMCDSLRFASIGQIWSSSQVISDRSSATPRRSVMGRWVWQFTSPGMASLPRPSITCSASPLIFPPISMILPSSIAIEQSLRTRPLGSTHATVAPSITISMGKTCKAAY
ncbi:hypothetical protein BMS3Abin16_00370 [archaeon BMS3Abin16]|nr:hypothetical protein BMS3Abin16_00370 [archaeon BMS3Abin16]